MRPAVRFLLLGAGLFAILPRGGGLPPAGRPLPADGEEALARAAAELQLDRDDAVIARRLQRNAEFLCLDAGGADLGLETSDLVVQRRLATRLRLAIEAQGRAAEPSDDELRAWVDAHRARYELPARVALTHVFFGGARRGAAAAADARRARVVLRRGGTVRGDALPIPGTLAPLSAEQLAGLLGDEVARAAFALPPGVWSAPVRSPFGLHLLRVTARYPARLPALETIRATAREDLLAERSAAALSAALRALRAGG
jgi:hypothetical protein